MINEALTFVTKTNPNAGYALLALGAYKLAEHSMAILGGVWKHCLRPRRWIKSRYARPNVEPWAVISGIFIKILISKKI